MALYLTRFSYTPETWGRLTKNPENRREAARKYIESVGGKLHGYWYAFGAYDGYCLLEAPNNTYGCSYNRGGWRWRLVEA
jgi:uncharacterized protein with GYD domain